MDWLPGGHAPWTGNEPAAQAYALTHNLWVYGWHSTQLGHLDRAQTYFLDGCTKFYEKKNPQKESGSGSGKSRANGFLMHVLEGLINLMSFWASVIPLRFFLKQRYSFISNYLLVLGDENESVFICNDLEFLNFSD